MALNPQQQAIFDKLRVMNSMPAVIAWGTPDIVGAMSGGFSGSRTQENLAAKTYYKFVRLGGNAELARLRDAVARDPVLNAAWNAQIAAGNKGDFISGIGDAFVSAVPLALQAAAAYATFAAVSATVSSVAGAPVASGGSAATVTESQALNTSFASGIGGAESGLTAANITAGGAAVPNITVAQVLQNAPLPKQPLTAPVAPQIPAPMPDIVPPSVAAPEAASVAVTVGKTVAGAAVSVGTAVATKAAVTKFVPPAERPVPPAPIITATTQKKSGGALWLGLLAAGAALFLI